MSKTVGTYNPPPPPTPNQPSMCQRLYTQDYQLLVDTFSILDENGSGVIDPSELSNTIKQLSNKDQSNPFVLSLLNGLVQLNQPITLELFTEWVTQQVGDFKSREGIQRIFNIYDSDCNQVVGTSEFQAVARSIHDCITQEEIDEMIHSIFVKWGTSSPNGLDFDEFYQVVTSYVQI